VNITHWDVSSTHHISENKGRFIDVELHLVYVVIGDHWSCPERS